MIAWLPKTARSLPFQKGQAFLSLRLLTDDFEHLDTGLSPHAKVEGVLYE